MKYKGDFLRRNKLLLSVIVLASFVAAIPGCVISPRRLPGQTPTPTPTPTGTPTPTASPTPTPTPVPPTPLGKLYVTNQAGNSILRFDNAFNSTGNVAPGAVITGATTTLNSPQAITLDTTADRLYVANAGAASVLVYDGISTKNGNVAPTRTIAGANTQFTAPSSVALDKGRDLLYVADGPDIWVFANASTVNGDVAATRNLAPTINAANLNIQQIFLDAANDRLYATDAAINTVAVFDNASTLNGPATPPRSVSGASTNLSQPSGIAIDPLGNLVITNLGNGSITVYANAASVTGNAAPTTTIAGAATTLINPSQIIQNTATGANEVFVADSAANEVVVFTGISTLNGNASPTRQITGVATTLTGTTTARGVALDTTR